MLGSRMLSPAVKGRSPLEQESDQPIIRQQTVALPLEVDEMCANAA